MVESRTQICYNISVQALFRSAGAMRKGTEMRPVLESKY